MEVARESDVTHYDRALLVIGVNDWLGQEQNGLGAAANTVLYCASISGGCGK